MGWIRKLLTFKPSYASRVLEQLSLACEKHLDPELSKNGFKVVHSAARGGREQDATRVYVNDSSSGQTLFIMVEYWFAPCDGAPEQLEVYLGEGSWEENRFSSLPLYKYAGLSRPQYDSRYVLHECGGMEGGVKRLAGELFEYHGGFLHGEVIKFLTQQTKVLAATEFKTTTIAPIPGGYKVLPTQDAPNTAWFENERRLRDKYKQ